VLLTSAHGVGVSACDSVRTALVISLTATLRQEVCPQSRLDDIATRAKPPTRQVRKHGQAVSARVSASPARTFVGDVTHAVDVEFVGVAEIVIVGVDGESPLA
jgi:hypothetical protein